MFRLVAHFSAETKFRIMEDISLDKVELFSASKPSSFWHHSTHYKNHLAVQRFRETYSRVPAHIISKHASHMIDEAVSSVYDAEDRFLVTNLGC